MCVVEGKEKGCMTAMCVRACARARARVCVCVCVCVRARALRIVSRDKILRFKNTFSSSSIWAFDEQRAGRTK